MRSLAALGMTEIVLAMTEKPLGVTEKPLGVAEKRLGVAEKRLGMTHNPGMTQRSTRDGQLDDVAFSGALA